MTIRPFEQNDFNECVKFFIETYNSQPWNYHWNIDNAAKYLSEYISSGEFLGFVLIDESGIPAVMFGHAKTWWTGNSLFIDELFVLPKKQGLGYGKMLMQYAERYCKENNFGNITLMTNRHMPAFKFYEKLDFIPAEHNVFLFKQV